jgi:hypothetical protein
LTRRCSSRLSTALAFAPWLSLSFLLTGCPLSDHYSLQSDGAGGDAIEGGASSSGSSAVSGAGGLNGFAGSLVSGAGGLAGSMSGASSSSAASANGGAPSAGSAGNPGAGADTSPDAGVSEGGEAGQGPASGGSATGGAAGSQAMAGTGGTSGMAGAGGAPACSALNCGYTCCAAGGTALLSCTDTTRDFQNCGSCGVLCNMRRSCMSSACTPGWVAMAPPPVGFAARWRAASVAMGSAVFIWGGSDSTGGVLDSGAIYSPVTDAWTPVAKDANTPTARVLATAVWTGSVVVVFGGSDAAGTTPYKDGGVYDPVAKAWSTLPVAGKARSSALGFWDGTKAIFYGGIGAYGAAVSGADRFDLTAWTPSSMAGDPGAVLGPAWAWDGAAMYLEGGLIGAARVDGVASYSSSTDAWANLSKSLSARSNAFGVWDGSHFLVWGGRDDMGNLHNDGKYQGVAAWTTLAVPGAPSARMAVPRRAGWIFQTSPGMIALLGGQTSLMGQGTFSTSGATYDVGAAKWTAIPAFPSGEAHDYGVAVWTGDEFVLWGGRTGAALTPSLTGERWKP